ncbi:DNA-binding response regulator [Bacillus sp. HMF5848]|uniref:response regulator transcription factor n=1 Tax=Bacillus sp. HMF5848 TaxID=2495421 RepID=UPI000F79BFE6|nr:response regulator transcription factor [Bacillus sp. HMF5848]RSK28592.1 DNA-binding response regulator [Bacillus sp. HMF5848]
MNNRILIVEDEKEIAELVRDYLKREGFEVHIAYDGEEGLEKFKELQPMIMILDILLPKLDGLEVCRIIRQQSNIPILMASAKKEDFDKVLGLGMGADDYIAKPFSPNELVARVKAQLRRYTTLANPSPQQQDEIQVDDIVVNKNTYDVYVKNKKIDVSAKEFQLLYYMMEHPGQVFTREQLFQQIWGQSDFGDINTVTVHIRKLREKIEVNPSTPAYILTVWGVGYKFKGRS